MRILLLGSDTPAGHSFRAFIPPLQRHELLLVPTETTQWSRERVLKKALKAANPDLILDARILGYVGVVDQICEMEIERTRWLAALAGRLDMGYLYLSSSRVFSGQMKRPYRESDTRDADSDLGRSLIALESILEASVPSLFILRLGWMFSGRGPCAFKLLLDSFRNGDDVLISENRRDCPVHTAEVARVVSGIIDQISVGAEARGLFHYGSDGDTGYYSFVEAVVACASQFDQFNNATELLQEVPGRDEDAVNRSLDCTAIRHQFGIQRRRWRDFVERAVRRYIELYCVEDENDG